MSNSRPSQKLPEDLEVLKSDVASFASSLGLASSSLPYSGFNDSDFRKTGKSRSQKQNKAQNDSFGQKQQEEQKHGRTQKTKSKNLNERGNNPRARNQTGDAQEKKLENSKPKPQILSVDDENSGFKAKRFEKYKNLPKLPLVKASLLSSEWYKDAGELEKKVSSGGDKGINNQKVVVTNVEQWRSVVEKKRELGERLIWQYTQDFNFSKGKSGDMKMVMAAQKSGTEADKVTAFEIMVGENPIANMRSLDAILGMVTSKVGKRYAFKGFKALSELFIKLLPDRKLKTLLQRPLNNIPETKDGYSLVLFWYWEECLKQRYERFVIALEEASRDMLPQLKDRALRTIYVLLTSKSEQERRLLAALVNKLGDPQNKSASNADFHLSNLLSDHPNMKAVVIDEVDSFLFRPRLGLRPKYHAVNFLSQIQLSHKGDGPKVAKHLIDVYFALFKVLIKEAGNKQGVDNAKVASRKKDPKDTKQKSSSDSHVELDSRILSALLTGVNRAFPYVSTDEVDDLIELQTPMLFKLVHSNNFNVAVQALMLLDKISSKNQIVSDRFYRALYSKLLLPSAMNSSKAEMFIGLLLRAMKSDVNLKRVAAFSKRILQVALQQPPQYACGCLFLLSEVLKARPPLWNKVLQSESVDEDDIEHFEDVKDENDTKPAKEAEKEADDAILDHDGDKARKTDSDSSSDDEDNLPAPESDEDDDASDDILELLITEKSHDLQETTEVSNNRGRSQLPLPSSCLPGGYNPRHREPAYCDGDRASWWELMVLASHVHPSVATMAGTLLSGTNIVYNGNPLNDLCLTAFLDKFMEKKPKQNAWHGGSQIEPAKKLDMSNHIIGPEMLALAESDVPPEDLVFHKFYVNKMNSTKKLKKKKKKKKLQEEEAAEELFDVDGGDGYKSDVDIEGGDESDNEEIENMLDAADGAMEAEDGGYDYDDLDKIVNNDDDDLVGNASDPEIDMDMDILDGEELEASPNDDADHDDDDEDIDIGGMDDDNGGGGGGVGGGDGRSEKRKHGKRKRKKASESPFASLEEYEHLMNQDEPNESEAKINRESKPRKKKKKNKPSSK